MNRHYFLGGNTPMGFYSYYDYLLDQQAANRIYAIKGGPGTGKSSMMKKTARWAEGKGYGVDYLHCSSDPDSLDGIVVRDIGVAMVDGTSPHIVDPKNPGAVDTILHLGEFWETDAIRERKADILACNAEISRLFTRAYKYLQAAGAFYQDVQVINRACLPETAVLDTADSIAAGTRIPGRIGAVRKSFLSAITPLGVLHYADTFSYGRVYVLKAHVAGGSGRVLAAACRRFLERGYDVECFYSPLCPTEVQHMTVPALDLFVTTDDFFTRYAAGAESRILDMDAMLDAGAVKKAAAELEESRTLVQSMTDRAVEIIRQAKAVHDALEKNYVPFMNFEKINLYQEQVVKDIERYI